MNSSIQSGLRLRTYQSGDESSLVELWKAAHTNVSGYVPKTPEYWKWCVIDRPGIEPEDIFILERGKRIYAYAVLARKKDSSGYSGTILEFAIDPSASNSQRMKIAHDLITATEERSRLRGDELLNFGASSKDDIIVRALERRGYKPESQDVFQLVIVDLLVLLRQILSKRNSAMPSRNSSSFRLDLQPGNYRYCPYKKVRIELHSDPVVEESTSDADYIVSTDLSTLADIIFRRDNFDNALRSDKIRVESEDCIEAVRYLFQTLRLKSEWYLPTVDGR